MVGEIDRFRWVVRFLDFAVSNDRDRACRGQRARPRGECRCYAFSSGTAGADMAAWPAAERSSWSFPTPIGRAAANWAGVLAHARALLARSRTVLLKMAVHFDFCFPHSLSVAERRAPLRFLEVLPHCGYFSSWASLKLVRYGPLAVAGNCQIIGGLRSRMWNEWTGTVRAARARVPRSEGALARDLEIWVEEPPRGQLVADSCLVSGISGVTGSVENGGRSWCCWTILVPPLHSCLHAVSFSMLHVKLWKLLIWG